MADRFPLIANSSANQIQELASADNLDLTGNSIVGVNDITARNITGIAATFTGVLTYEDVTNVDSIGVVTARSGIKFGSAGVGGTITADGHAEFVGVVTAQGSIEAQSGIKFGSAGAGGTVTADGYSTLEGGLNVVGITSVSHFETTGRLVEKVNVTAGKLSDNININLDNGMVHLFTTQETTTSTPNIMSSTGINTDMNVGDAISVTIVTTAAAAAYSAQLTIDGDAVTENWTGGSAPSDGGSSGVDIYAYTIMKTASATYTVLATQTKTS